MNILTYRLFLENKHEIQLHYAAFDWDDNILHMPTVIHMDKLEGDKWVPIDVSTADFAKVRNDKVNYRMRNNDANETYCEFRDFGPRGNKAFLEDTKRALSKDAYGPAWDAFIKCLTEGSIFAIITARGHEPEAIRMGVEYLIDNVISEDEKFLMYSNCLKHSYLFRHEVEFDRIPKGQLSKTPLIKTYLDNCDFWGVSSESFRKDFLEKYWAEGNASNPEKAKEMALDFFIKKCNEFGKKVGAKSVSVGFSDDDPGNVEHVRKFFKETTELNKALLSHQLKLNLYNTNDRTLKGGIRSKFATTESSVSTQAPGMQSSIMPFTQFNNQSARLFPADDKDKDPANHTLKMGADYLAKNSKDILGKKNKKKKIRRTR